MNGILTQPNRPFIPLLLKAHVANDISSRLTFPLLPRSFFYLTPASLFTCMPIPHPPYPSFTLVMSSPPFAAHSNTRLPAYRASHPSRFHPYARTHPSLHEEPHMATVDYRLLQPPVRPIGDVAPMMPTMGDGKAENKSETSTIAAESILRRKKLKTAAGRLSAVIVTLRRIYRGTSVKQAEEKLKFELMN